VDLGPGRKPRLARALKDICERCSMPLAESRLGPRKPQHDSTFFLDF